MPDKMDCPLATDVLLGQVDDALARIGGGLEIVAFDVVTVGVPDMATMAIVPAPQVLVVARGHDLSGPGKFITGWNLLTGFWETQEDVDAVVRTVIGRIRESRARQAGAANGAKTAQ